MSEGRWVGLAARLKCMASLLLVNSNVVEWLVVGPGAVEVYSKRGIRSASTCTGVIRRR